MQRKFSDFHGIPQTTVFWIPALYGIFNVSGESVTSIFMAHHLVSYGS